MGYRRSSFKFSGQPHTLRSEFRRDGALQLGLSVGNFMRRIVPPLIKKVQKALETLDGDIRTLGLAHLWYQGCVLYEISETADLGQT